MRYFVDFSNALGQTQHNLVARSQGLGYFLLHAYEATAAHSSVLWFHLSYVSLASVRRHFSPDTQEGNLYCPFENALTSKSAALRGLEKIDD